MKLGGKSKDVEGFVDQLMQEGEHVASLDSSRKQPGVTSTVAAQPQTKNERYLNIYTSIYLLSVNEFT